MGEIFLSLFNKSNEYSKQYFIEHVEVIVTKLT